MYIRFHRAQHTFSDLNFQSIDQIRTSITQTIDHQSSSLNLSLTQQENTHNHWVWLASSQALGLFSEKTKRHMTCHKKVIYNQSKIQPQRTKSQAN